MKSGGRDEYLVSFLIEAVLAALPAEWDVECRYESARVLTTIILLLFFLFIIIIIIIIYCALPGGAGVSCRSAVQRECDTRRPSRVGRLGTGSGHPCRQRRTAAGQCSTTSMRRSTTTDLSAARLPAGTARDERGFGPSMGWAAQCSRIRILRFFEMTHQKVVKSHQQKFSPQYVTKE